MKTALSVIFLLLFTSILGSISIVSASSDVTLYLSSISSNEIGVYMNTQNNGVGTIGVQVDYTGASNVTSSNNNSKCNLSVPSSASMPSNAIYISCGVYGSSGLTGSNILIGTVSFVNSGNASFNIDTNPQNTTTSLGSSSYAIAPSSYSSFSPGIGGTTVTPTSTPTPTATATATPTASITSTQTSTPTPTTSTKTTSTPTVTYTAVSVSAGAFVSKITPVPTTKSSTQPSTVIVSQPPVTVTLGNIKYVYVSNGSSSTSTNSNSGLQTIVQGYFNNTTAALLFILPIIVLLLMVGFMSLRMFQLKRNQKREIELLFEHELGSLATLESKLDIIDEKGGKSKEEFKEEFDRTRDQILKEIRPEYIGGSSK